LAGDFMILDLFCALSTVLIFSCFIFHLHALVFATVFSLSDSLSEITIFSLD